MNGRFLLIGAVLAMAAAATGTGSSQLAAQPAPAQTAASTMATASLSSDPDEATLKEIKEIRDGMIDALNKNDMEKELTYLHPEIIVTWANGEVSHGPKEVKAYCDRMLNGPGKIVEKITANPEIEGRKLYGPNVLISYGNLRDTFKLTDGKEFTLNSRFSSLLVRENGKWLLKGFHASANVFDNEIQTIIVKKVALWTGIGAAVVGLVIGFIAGRATGKKRAA